MKSFVFITHTGIFLCPITSRPSVLLLGIFNCQIHSTLESNWFHLNFSCTSNKHGDIDETSNVSELSVSICKVKLIFFIYFRKDLRKREREYFSLFKFHKGTFQKNFYSLGGKSMERKHTACPHPLPPFPWEWVTGLSGEVEKELSRCDSASSFYGAVCPLNLSFPIVILKAIF